MESTDDEIISTLREEDCWALLERCELGRLAVCIRGKPDIFPVNYVTDGPRILFRTAPGSKLAALSAAPDVAFEVDEYDDMQAASVVVRGVAAQLELLRDIEAADALPLAPWTPTLKYRWVQIVPRSISGRRFERGPEPDRYVASDDTTT